MSNELVECTICKCGALVIPGGFSHRCMFNDMTILAARVIALEKALAEVLKTEGGDRR